MSGPPSQSPWGSGWPFPMSSSASRRRAYSVLPPPRAFRSPNAENTDITNASSLNNNNDDDGGVKLDPFPAPSSSSSFSSHFHPSSSATPPSSLQPPVGIERTALGLRTANAGAAAVNRLREAAGVSRGAHGRSEAHKRGFSVAAESFRPLGLGPSSPMEVPEPLGLSRLRGAHHASQDSSSGSEYDPRAPYMGSTPRNAAVDQTPAQGRPAPSFAIYRDPVPPLLPHLKTQTQAPQPSQVPPELQHPYPVPAQQHARVSPELRHPQPRPLVPQLQPSPPQEKKKEPQDEAAKPVETRRFKPMNALDHSQRSPHETAAALDGRDVVWAEDSAFSNNYRGERSARNASVEQLPDSLNCALWITNLPPDVTYSQLLSAVRNVGRVFCTVINSPDYVHHQTAAAKLVFFQPGPAQRLRAQSLNAGIELGGRRAKVAHNRVKHSEQPVEGSRVLIVTGDARHVNEEALTAWFDRRFVFQVDRVTTLIRDEARGRAVVEFKFGSYRCQAQMGKMALEKDAPEWLMKVEFGQDPCEVGDDMTSYGVAGMRIQGLGI